jgi:hypothetical protein
MTNSDEYKRQIMRDLAGGNTESLNSSADESINDYQSFDDFAQRSTRDERRQWFGKAFNPERIPVTQMEPELQKALSQIQPNERDDVAKEFFNHFKKRGLSDRDLEQQLGLSTHNPNRMSADDVAKLAGFAYHNHPDIFQDVLSDRPGLIKFLSNPIVGATLGALAAKWLNRH